MALAFSIGLALLVGVMFMFHTQYFWGKESNSNINTINCTLTNLSNSFGSINVVIVLIVIAGAMLAVTYYSSSRGF